ncbi:MAG: alpha-ribazole phosphatase [Pararhodobacter sp.]
MAVILLRHTRPVGAEGLCYGRTDLALDDGFASEAARLAEELPSVRRILSSPLSRCRRLAEAIGAARDLAVEVDPRLAEMDFGTWEKTPWAEIPRDQLDAWAEDFLGARPHGGESVAELWARVREALDAAVTGPVPVLAVTHAGVIKAALASGKDMRGWQTETDFGGWRRVDWP